MVIQRQNIYTTETSKVGQYKRGAKTSNKNDWKRIQVNLDLI